MYKFTFVFTKNGKMKFISHLDLMRLFMRALRRAEFPLRITEGFSPHVKLSIERALKLGVESDAERASVIFTKFISPGDFSRCLNAQLPEGIMVKEAEALAM